MSAAAALFAVAAPCTVTPSPASGQVIQPPPRSAVAQPTVDPRRTQQVLTVTFDALGGYDDNVAPDGGVAPSDPTAPVRPSTTGTIGADARYRLSKGRSDLEVLTHAQMDSFRNIGVRPLIGGTANVRASTRLGRGFTLQGQANTEYHPTFTFSGFEGASISAGGLAPDVTTGALEIRSVIFSVSGELARQWSPLQRSVATVSRARSDYSGLGGVDSRFTTFGVDHSWTLARALALRGAYQQSHSLSLEPFNLPLDSYYVSGGVQLTKRVSRTRRLELSVRPGMMHVRTRSAIDARPIDYIAPSGTVGVRTDLGRTWAVSGDWQREVTLVEELTAQSFLTDSISTWVGGEVGRRLVVSALTSYAHGAPHQGETGSYEMLRATLQVQHFVARCCAVVGSYSYGRYTLQDVSAVPDGLPHQFERNALRGGVNVWLPVFGVRQTAPRSGFRRD
jgi:hypothetical protein